MIDTGLEYFHVFTYIAAIGVLYNSDCVLCEVRSETEDKVDDLNIAVERNR